MAAPSRAGAAAARSVGCAGRWPPCSPCPLAWLTRAGRPHRPLCFAESGGSQPSAGRLAAACHALLGGPSLKTKV